ncbi:MAG: MgtC/SapB family protein [Clostridia bacterium]|nr:MgtC/SapB family protein [Clostridia bacterium]
MGEYGLRLLLATLCGALLGAERSFRRKDAGVRTHSILSLATCLFMLLSKYAFFGAQGGADPTMIACQIVMGINFMGAGIIFRSGQIISHGLTTAAGIWATAAIGMACGCGMKLLACLFTLMIFGLHLLIQRFNIGGTAYTPREMKITVENTPEMWEVLRQMQQHYQIQILSLRCKRKAEGNTVKLILQVQLLRAIPMEDIIHLMDAHKEFKEFSI